MRRAPTLAACAIVLAVMALAVAIPAGGASNSKVSVSIGFNTGRGDPFFKGQVSSGRAACERNRLVRVYRQQNKRRILFGRDRANADGYWRVNMAARMKTAGYIAVVKATGACLKGYSAAIAVGQRGPGGLGPGGTGK